MVAAVLARVEVSSIIPQPFSGLLFRNVNEVTITPKPCYLQNVNNMVSQRFLNSNPEEFGWFTNLHGAHSSSRCAEKSGLTGIEATNFSGYSGVLQVVV